MSAASPRMTWKSRRLRPRKTVTVTGVAGAVAVEDFAIGPVVLAISWPSMATMRSPPSRMGVLPR